MAAHSTQLLRHAIRHISLLLMVSLSVINIVAFNINTHYYQIPLEILPQYADGSHATSLQVTFATPSATVNGSRDYCCHTRQPVGHYSHITLVG